MASVIGIRAVGESGYKEWNEMIAASPGGSIYSTPEYLDVLCGAAGGRFRLLAADRGGEMVGGIAVWERDTAWGTYLAGRYLLYYNGFVVKPHISKYPSENTSKQIEILTQLEEVVRGAKYGRVSIRSRSMNDIRVFVSRGWAVKPSYTYVVPLLDLKDLWSRVEQNLRRLVSRCTRDAIEFTDDDDFASYFRLHLHTASRKGAGIYLPADAFQRYFTRLRNQNLCRIFHARLPDGLAISSQLVLTGGHPVSHTVSTAAAAEHLRTGATAFLRWKVFERLAELGLHANDLTDAELNPVTHFKSQLGGDLQMNLVLTRPDRAGFIVESSLQHAKTAVTTLAARISSALRQPASQTAERTA